MAQVLYCSEDEQEAREFANKISAKLVKYEIKNFTGNEKFLKVNQNIDFNEAIYIYKSFWPAPNDKIMELVLLLDLLESNGAKNIRLIIPFIPYLRQDREVLSNSSVGARALARLLRSFNIEEIITYDAHSENSMSFFEGKITNLNYYELFASRISKENFDQENSIVISPDQGSKFRAKNLAELLSVKYCALTKKRIGSEVVITGFDNSRIWDQVIIIDDIIDTGGTILSTIELISECSKKITICISHIVNIEAINKIKNKYAEITFIDGFRGG